MAIQPICDKCKKELTNYGGLLFSPPNEKREVQKWHLCNNCYQKILREL